MAKPSWLSWTNERCNEMPKIKRKHRHTMLIDNKMITATHVHVNLADISRAVLEKRVHYHVCV